MKRSPLRRTLVVACAALLTVGAAFAAAGAARAASFGQVFKLDNPSHPFGLGVQDVEPSIRVDTLGNVFPGAIRGVPAGVGPGSDNDPGIGLGGGDIDLASSCDTNLLNVSSLAISDTNNFQSTDQG